MTQPSRLIAAIFAFAILAACSPQATNGASNVTSAQLTNEASIQPVSGALPPVSASGGAGGGGGGLRQICAADFQQYCPNFVWGAPGGLWECMRGRLKQFSPPCRTALLAAEIRWHSAKPAQTQSAAPATQ